MYWLGYLALAGFLVLAPLPGRLSEAIARASMVLVAMILVTWFTERKPSSEGGVRGKVLTGIKAVAMVVVSFMFLATCVSVRFDLSKQDDLPIYWQLSGIVSVMGLSICLEMIVGRLIGRPFGGSAWAWRRLRPDEEINAGRPM